MSGASTSNFHDIPMTNTPNPRLERPTVHDSPETRLQRAQALYEQVEWLEQGIRILLESRTEMGEQLRGQEEQLRSQERQIQELAERARKQEDMNSTFHMAVTGLKSSSSFQTKTTEPKVSDPTPFDGDKTQVENFITACETKFAGQPSQFPSEASKVTWASSFLRGVPQSWWQPTIKAYAAARAAGSPPPSIFSSFLTFAQSLRELFGDPNLARNCMTALEHLNQTASVTEYIAQFEAYRQYTKYDSPVVEMRFFYRGLKDALKDRISGKKYETLKELQDLATKYDIRIQERNAERAAERNSSRPWTQPTIVRVTPTPSMLRPPPPMTRPTHTTPSADGSTPMEIDAQGARHITREEKERRWKENLCLYCGKGEHRISGCAEAKAAAARAAARKVTAIEVEVDPQPRSENDSAER
jgi:hypothetical protein